MFPYPSLKPGGQKGASEEALCSAIEASVRASRAAATPAVAGEGSDDTDSGPRIEPTSKAKTEVMGR